MLTPRLTLVSHLLCPYVQRAAIVLMEKGQPFERRDVDLARKPDWFLQLSPLGKTPVLVAQGRPVFESAVICEYLDDTLSPRLHPQDALMRARHRGWMEFGSAMLNGIAGFYNAPDETTLAAKAADLRHRLGQLEAELGPGPYFAGSDFCIVDAVFGPVFRYFEVFESLGDFGFFTSLPKVQAWRQALAQRLSVRQAAPADYARLLRDFLLARGSALSALMVAQAPTQALRSPVAVE